MVTETQATIIVTSCKTFVDEGLFTQIPSNKRNDTKLFHKTLTKLVKQFSQCTATIIVVNTLTNTSSQLMTIAR